MPLLLGKKWSWQRHHYDGEPTLSSSALACLSARLREVMTTGSRCAIVWYKPTFSLHSDAVTVGMGDLRWFREMRMLGRSVNP
jgi:hypothetical protein